MDELKPPSGRNVLLYARGDLYPIVACRMRGRMTDGPRESDYYVLEEGGPEDGTHRKYPILSDYKPTHWAELPTTPYEEEILDGR
jgi:hypothetical protein